MTNDTFISLQTLSFTNRPYFEALRQIYIYTVQVIYVPQDSFSPNKLLIVKFSLLIFSDSTSYYELRLVIRNHIDAHSRFVTAHLQRFCQIYI